MYTTIFFTGTNTGEAPTKPAGAYACANAIRSAGFTSLVVDYFFDYTLDELEDLFREISSSSTLLIGISTSFLLPVSSGVIDVDISDVDVIPDMQEIFCPQGAEFEEGFVGLIRRYFPNAKIAIGGTFSAWGQKNQHVDYAFHGDAELSIVRLLRSLINPSLPIQCAVNKHGVKVIEELPAPPFKFTEMRWEKLDVLNFKVLPIEIARGCKFRCLFCSYPKLGLTGSDYIRDGESVYNEMLDNYVKFGIEHYRIVDSTFNENPDKLAMMLSVVERLPFQPKFWAYIRLDLVAARPESIDILYRIGIREMVVGLETLNPETAKLIRKGGNERLVSTLAVIAEKYPDMKVKGSFIFGLPGESIESMQNTFDRLLSGEVKLWAWNASPLRLVKEDSAVHQSEMDKKYNEYGYRLRPDKQQTSRRLSNMFEWESDITSFTEVTRMVTENANRRWENKSYNGVFYICDGLVNVGVNEATANNLTHSKKIELWNDHKRENKKLLIEEIRRMKFGK